MDWNKLAKGMVSYYELLTIDHPTKEEWAIGLSIASAWLELVEETPVSEISRDKVNELKIMVQEFRSTYGGSGAIDLEMQILGWSRKLQD